MNLDLLTRMNKRHATQHPQHTELAARLESYELAFRMQTEVPNAIDLSDESEQTQRMYGIGNDATDAFGRTSGLPVFGERLSGRHALDLLLETG